MGKSEEGRIFVATESFSVSGYPPIMEGTTTVREGHELVEGREDFFKPLKPTFELEDTYEPVAAPKPPAPVEPQPVGYDNDTPADDGTTVREPAVEEPAKFDRPAAIARLKELEVEFKGNASNDTLAELLEAHDGAPAISAEDEAANAAKVDAQPTPPAEDPLPADAKPEGD